MRRFFKSPAAALAAYPVIAGGLGCVFAVYLNDVPVRYTVFRGRAGQLMRRYDRRYPEARLYMEALTL